MWNAEQFFVRAGQRCGEGRIWLDWETDSKVLREIHSPILTREETPRVSSDKVSFVQEVGGLAALSAQAHQLAGRISTDKRASRDLAVATKSRLPGINLANWLTVLGLCRF
jgi:hypothetical protein